MRRLFIFLLILPILALLTDGVSAQSNFAVAPVADGAQQIALGNSALALIGPWKFRLGDNMAWAQPGFDDSGWEDYTLKAQGWSDSLLNPRQGSDPGWSGHGHRGVWGYGWYRTHIQFQQASGSASLLLPFVDSAYTVYWDGANLGSFGDTNRHLSYVERTKLFRIPHGLSSRGRHVLALRIWDRPVRAVSDSPVSGGLRGAPLLAESGYALRLQLLQWRSTALSDSLLAMDELFPCFFVGVVSLLLYGYNRKQREYLWIGLTLLGTIVSDTVLVLGHTFSGRLPTNSAYAIFDVIAQSFFLFGLLAAQWLLGLQHRRWMRAANLFAGGGYLLAYAALVLNAYVILSRPLDRMLEYAVFALIPCVAALLWMAVEGIRKQGSQAWLMLSPWIVTVATYVFGAIASGRVRADIFLAIIEILEFLVPLSVLMILIYRFLRQRRDYQLLQADFQQAREVQQVLIPEELPDIPGLTIESEYRPAREVGGDFFQILPNSADGSVLIVVGDVTGHGLQAGMLVALIVGAIRNQTETSFDSLRMLQSLNRSLLGRGSAHATCLALRITQDGSATLANAGHLPPYLNGKEMAMEGALPLGMMAGAEFSVMQFQLAPGDRLMLMSDGVAEAQDEQGQLFGFERINTMLEQPVTAADVATAAQNFGQEDDILVLRVVRG